MTAPRFRSTTAFTMRQRHAAPSIDRATFVIFSLGGQRFAAPAESVERVLRHASPDASGMERVVLHGRQIPCIDLRGALRNASPDVSDVFGGVSTGAAVTHGQRTLVFSVMQAWVAATVDAVYEVATIDASHVRPVESGLDHVLASSIVAVRGRFVRHDHDVLVLDMLRVVRAVYEATKHAAGLASPIAAERA